MDLSLPNVQSAWLGKLASFNTVLTTPPCKSHSRLAWANSFGPQPLRSATYPGGFPWLSAADRMKADYHNALITFSFAILQAIDTLQARFIITGFMEHPEDLGRVRSKTFESVPASVWRDTRALDLCSNGAWWCGAFRQCDYGAPTPSPTRCIANSLEFAAFADSEMPTFDSEGFYSGPVQRCDHNHTATLLRSRNEVGPFKSAAKASYPSAMCKLMAQCLVNSFINWKAKSPADGGVPSTSLPFPFPPPPPLPDASVKMDRVDFLQKTSQTSKPKSCRYKSARLRAAPCRRSSETRCP